MWHEGGASYCYRGDGITKYVYQINTLYTLNLYNVECQLYLNKKGISH